MSRFFRASRLWSSAKTRRIAKMLAKRRVGVEALEQRLLFAADMPTWNENHNYMRPRDVNGDGKIVPGDVLIIANALNTAAAKGAAE